MATSMTDPAADLGPDPVPTAARAPAPAQAPEDRPWQTLRVQRDGAVLHVTLNRPAARNAMTVTMVDELRAVLDAAQAGLAVRVIVLRGAQGHFCAGADLKDMGRMPITAGAANAAGLEASAGAVTPPAADAAADPIAALNARFGELCVAYAGTGLATVAVLEGTVMGGGFGLACVVDVAIASTDVVFRLPETSLGLLPAQIAPFLMERLGWSQARRLCVTGARLDAVQAQAIGLVHGVHAGDALDGALQAVLRDILQCAPGAVAATKALMAQGRFAPPADMVGIAAAAFARAAHGPEGREGLAAFAEKRRPAWSPPSAARGTT